MYVAHRGRHRNPPNVRIFTPIENANVKGLKKILSSLQMDDFNKMKAQYPDLRRERLIDPLEKAIYCGYPEMVQIILDFLYNKKLSLDNSKGKLSLDNSEWNYSYQRAWSACIQMCNAAFIQRNKEIVKLLIQYETYNILLNFLDAGIAKEKVAEFIKRGLKWYCLLDELIEYCLALSPIMSAHEMMNVLDFCHPLIPKITMKRKWDLITTVKHFL